MLAKEFDDAVIARRIVIAGKARLVGMFLELMWDPFHELAVVIRSAGASAAVQAMMEKDPAFVVEGVTRFVALARLGGEIRYFAAPIPKGTRADPDRAAAIEEEVERSESGVLASADDAVTFVYEYLLGATFEQVSVKRKARLPA